MFVTGWNASQVLMPGTGGLENAEKTIPSWEKPMSRSANNNKPELSSSETESRILSLLQFARKAGKIIHGTDACLRGIFGSKIHLIVLAADISDNTLERILRKIDTIQRSVAQIKILDKSRLSQALGVPDTAVFGVTDKQFATRILELWQASNGEEPCDKSS